MSFLSQELITELQKAPKFSFDASTLKDKRPEEITSLFSVQDGKVIINISLASEPEKEAIMEAVEKLPKGKVVLWDQQGWETQVCARITMEICANFTIFDSYMFYFRMKEEKRHLRIEWEQFVVKHQTIEDTHHWTNIGLPQKNDPRREEIKRLLPMYKGYLVSQVPLLSPHPHIKSQEEVIFTLLLAMLSNLVRGLFYHYSSPKAQTYYPRQVAAKVAEEWQR